MEKVDRDSIHLRSSYATEIGLLLPEGLAYEEWAEIGLALVPKRGVSWWLGDWWLYRERTYGEGTRRAIPTEHALHTIQNAAWVASKFDRASRRKDLPFSHHAEVAGLDPAERDEMLDRATREGWGRGVLRSRVRELRSGGYGSDETDVLIRFCGCPF